MVSIDMVESAALADATDWATSVACCWETLLSDTYER